MLTYETDTRGRAGTFKPEETPPPRVPLPAAASTFDTEERKDGLHLVNVETGQSFGIMATPAIAADQLNALRRMTS